LPDLTSGSEGQNGESDGIGGLIGCRLDHIFWPGSLNFSLATHIGCRQASTMRHHVHDQDLHKKNIKMVFLTTNITFID
jgi:hypothetical protein